MPARNSIKTYVENGIYHVYNRGVEKRQIFLDTQDYQVFLRILKDSLSPSQNAPSTPLQGQTLQGNRKPRNFFGQIEILAYCLMPNHFHLIIKQTKPKSIVEWMQSVTTRYSMYFNKKHKRIGSLFQGRYKGIMILDDPYLLHLSRYIHRNPIEITNNLKSYYSSYGEYIGIRHTTWINSAYIMNYFTPGTLPGLHHINSYEDFVENYTEENTELLDSFSFDDPS
jgi:putative transposase